ncbi:CAP domain-containing protein (plasmid) [Streptomyces sp. NBC_01717]|uniref:CAP domain-containing protein n=1 Tax=Streptomyces sp. NBC_01717 TaxID=2975918 RepID=UPI002E35EE8E|nr:CAP domain-containing protein [Streptomyces sp. NBC_01717]
MAIDGQHGSAAKPVLVPVARVAVRHRAAAFLGQRLASRHGTATALRRRAAAHLSRARSGDMTACSSGRARGSRQCAGGGPDARRGYPEPAAENIARGQANAPFVVRAWMNSPGHRANIVGAGLAAIGVGVHLALNGPWWMQNVGYESERR